jgi:hypothetical protein
MTQISGTPYVNIVLLTTSNGKALVFIKNTMLKLQCKWKVTSIAPVEDD